MRSKPGKPPPTHRSEEAERDFWAHKQDVPYQCLLKIYLAERIRQEYGMLERAG